MTLANVTPQYARWRSFVLTLFVVSVAAGVAMTGALLWYALVRPQLH